MWNGGWIILKELAACQLESARIAQNQARCDGPFSLLLSSSFHNIAWCLDSRATSGFTGHSACTELDAVQRSPITPPFLVANGAVAVVGSLLLGTPHIACKCCELCVQQHPRASQSRDQQTRCVEKPTSQARASQLLFRGSLGAVDS